MGGFRSALFLLGMAAGDAPPPSLYGLPAPAHLIQVLLGDADGRISREIRPKVGAVSWEINSPGGGSFQIPVGMAQELGALLRQGNRVLLQFDNGLPGWAGIITGSAEWDAKSGMVTYMTVGLAEVFSWRLTAPVMTYIGATVESVIGELVASVDGMSMGEVDIAPGVIEVTFNYMTLKRAIQQILPVDGNMMDVVGCLTGSTITGVVNIRKRWSAARMTAEAILVEGHNLGDVAYRVEDAIVNRLHLVGRGAGWEPTTRPMVTVTDSDSEAMYGVREDVLFVDPISSAGILSRLGESIMARSAYPRTAVMGTAINRTPGAYGDYGIGSMIKVMAPSIGMAGDYELVAREFDPKLNLCTIALEGHL